MLLGNKKEQDHEKNWCVVLKSLENELDKKKTAKKISEIFSLSADESADLVASTPIILLDNLTRTIAAKLKDYFQSFGAELALSNDTVFKRKCYRTVWPQTPNLAFLHDWKPETVCKSQAHLDQLLDPDDALNEVRSLGKNTASPEETKTREDTSSRPFSYQDFVVHEMKPWEKKPQTEEPSQPASIPRSSPVQAEDSPGLEAGVSAGSLEQQEKKIKEMRASLGQAEEKYEALKDEYREARSLFEEKILVSKKEQEQLVRKVEEMSLHYQSVQKEQERLQREMREKDHLYDRLKHEKDYREKQLEERVIFLQKGWDAQKQSLEEARRDFAQAESAKKALEDSAAGHLSQISSLQNQCQMLEKSLEGLKQKISEQEAALAERSKPQEPRQEGGQWIQDLEFRSQWALRYSNLEKQIAAVQWTQAKQQETLDKILEGLEGVIVHEKNSGQPLVKQDRIQEEEGDPFARELKKLDHRLVDKEGLLKRLVKDQESVEKEIRDREEALRKLLTDQEVIEKEILEARQAKYHLSLPGRNKKDFPGDPPDSEA